MAFVGAWTGAAGRVGFAVRRACAVSNRAVREAAVRPRRATLTTTRMQFDSYDEDDSDRRERSPPSEEVSDTKLFIGNLAWAVDDDELEHAFSPYGAILEAKVIRDRESGRSRGFGFITFEESAGVNDALEAMDGQELKGREIRVNRAEAKPRGGFNNRRPGGGRGGGRGGRYGGGGGGGGRFGDDRYESY